MCLCVWGGVASYPKKSTFSGVYACFFFFLQTHNPQNYFDPQTRLGKSVFIIFNLGTCRKISAPKLTCIFGLLIVLIANLGHFA